jgi:hypothetical protein
MMNSNKMLPYLIGAGALGALLLVLGVPLTTVLPFAIILVFPLMKARAMFGPDNDTPPPSDPGAQQPENSPAARER